MLILTRKPGQDILIGHNIIVTILETYGNNVHVGITAPKEIKIMRPEAKKKYREEPNKTNIGENKDEN